MAHLKNLKIPSVRKIDFNEVSLLSGKHCTYLLGGMASNIRSLRSVIKVHDLHSSLYCSFFLFSYSSNVNKKCLTHFQLNSESCFLLSRTFFILHS